jgi:uncharacterized membrane protein
MNKILASLVLASLAMSAQAGEIIVHTASVHTEKMYALGNETKELNNVNVGIGYRNDDGLTVGAYKNSYYHNTVYITQDLMYNEYVGVVVGASTGYKVASGLTITPMLAAIVKIPVNETVTINVLAMPKVGKFIGVAHLALSYKF